VFVDDPNASILLNGANSTGAGLTYLWLSNDGIILDGETKTTALVSGLGIYYLQVTDSLGCTDRDSVNVGIYIQAINDTASTKVNESVTINVVRNDIPQNAINPSSISIVTPPLHGIATVLADSLVIYSPEMSYTGQDEFIYAICDYFNNCDNAKVLVLINDVPLFAPDAFSPNGDGINDKFVILGLEKYKTVKIEIYNRWGNIVYQANNYGEGEGKSGFWDGTAGAWDGKATTGLRIGSGPVPSGTYYYILTLNGNEKISKSVYLDR
jgi:gliding motility-associated-like protein